MARSSNTLLLVVLIVLMTIFAVMQGLGSYTNGGAVKPVRAPAGLPSNESADAAALAGTSLWPLCFAIGVAALLLHQELGSQPQKAEPAEHAIVPVYTQESTRASNLPQSRQTSSSQLALMSDTRHSARGQALTKVDLEHALARALEMTSHNTIATSPHHHSGGDSFVTVRESMGEHLGWKGCTGEMTAAKVCEMEKTMVEELEMSMMVKIGWIANTFHAWHAEAQLQKGVRRMEQKLHLRHEEWEAYMATEKERFAHETGVLREREALLRSKWGQKVALIMDQWALGDTTGLYVEAFRAWEAYVDRECVIRAQMRRTEIVSKCAMGALLKWMDGDGLGAAHTCFLQWQQQAARSLAERVHDRKLQHAKSKFTDERREWERLLEDKSKSHADDLRAYLSQEEIRRRKAHEATELMLAKWMHGDARGLLSTIVLEWRRYVVEMDALQARRQSVHVSVLRFMEGAEQAAAHACLLNWKGYTKEQLVYKNEVAESKRKIVQLQERMKSVLGSQQLRLIKYSTALCGNDTDALLVMVLYAWHVEAQGTAAADLHRRQELELEERKRLHDLAVTKHRHHAAAAVVAMGFKDKRIFLVDVFTAWLQVFQAKRQEWAHKLITNESAEKYASAMLHQFMTRDQKSLLASVFWEFMRQMRLEIQERHREELQTEREELETSLRRMRDDEMKRLQDELARTYAQVDKVTETLQQEIKTKEELAEELHDACHKLRCQSSLLESSSPKMIEEVTTRTKRLSRGATPRS